MRDYQVDYNKYSFKAEDDWGDYDYGKYRDAWFNSDGYSQKNYLCTDGKWHTMEEHLAKWEFFNGRVQEGMQIDHIIPVKNGGTNKLSNLRLATPKENANNVFSVINQSKCAKKLWQNEEYRNKIVKSQKQSWLEGKRCLSQAFLEMSKKHNEEISVSVDQIDPITGEVLATFPSIRDTARNTGFNKERIRYHTINGGTYKGFIWKTY